MRTVGLPSSSCLTTPAWNKTVERIERLCCANTHVVCDRGQAQAELTSYDGSVFRLRGRDVEAWLEDAFRRVCAMSMARRFGDCREERCTGQRRGAVLEVSASE